MTARTNRYEDDDASHLPPGMKRVGYDADTERYTFREGDDLWLGQPGSFYGGELKWAGKAPDADEDEDEEQEDEDGSSSYTEHASNVRESKSRGTSSRKLTHESTFHASGSPEEHVHGLWGVPVISISATGAKPPDSPKDESGTMQTRANKFKKVATFTVNALRVANRRPRKDSA